MGNIRITHIDGAMPNLALMRLSAWHKHIGDNVYFTKNYQRDILEPDSYDMIYGSAIFKFSKHKQDMFLNEFPDAIMGGTGTTSERKVEDFVPDDWDEIDYSIYPSFDKSLGFSQRGCRLKCGFCVVPKKEGKNVSEMPVSQIWRGEPYPKDIILLDNDFFGQPDWQDKVDEIVDRNFRIALIQGINVRLISEKGAVQLARMKYMDGQFKSRRIYTAWDNIGDEKVFFRGVKYMTDAGIPTNHIMAYMLIGYSEDETLEEIEYRFWKMADLGIKPYPMVYDRSNKVLCDFQRWAIRRLYTIVPFSEYSTKVHGYVSKRNESQMDLV